jgi:hypothetical protein
MVTSIEGGPSHDASHLRSHVEEGYLHGSLIRNAMQWAGVLSSPKAALRGYLFHELVERPE